MTDTASPDVVVVSVPSAPTATSSSVCLEEEKTSPVDCEVRAVYLSSSF